MKIATWNIERQTKSTKNFSAIINLLKAIDADILILTETSEEIHLGDLYYVFHTSKPKEQFYKDGETRVTIFSKFPASNEIETFRNDISICVNLQTPIGQLAVYGTIIGIFGNRLPSFAEDLNYQILDFEKIAKSNNVCISGDLNISFADNFYFTNEGRDKLNQIFNNLELENLTAGIPKNIDHIILSKKFIDKKKITKEFWNHERNLSDHLGVAITLS